MTDCIFCKIVAREVPSYEVYEDDSYYAFLDIDPHVAGHTLVIPKNHVQWVSDAPKRGEYWETAHRVGDLLKEKLDADFIQFFTFGLEVPHAHIHVLPRYIDGSDKGVLPPKFKMTQAQLVAVAQRIQSWTFIESVLLYLQFSTSNLDPYHHEH